MCYSNLCSFEFLKGIKMFEKRIGKLVSKLSLKWQKTLVYTLLPATCLFLIGMAVSPSARAGSVGGANAAMETTQYLNYGELYNQTNQSMSQLQTQMNQLANLKKQVMAGGAIQDFASTKQLFGNVVSTVKQAQGIGYDSQVMAGRFSSLYPDFNAKTGTDFFTQYGKWSKDLNGLLKASMGTANLHVSNFANDATTSQTLQDKVKSANTAESQVAVINAGNEVALGTYQELQQMRQMQAVQNAAQTSFLAKQTGETDKKAGDDKKFKDDMSWNPPCYPNCTAAYYLKGASK